jgi:hypothetical protein
MQLQGLHITMNCAKGYWFNQPIVFSDNLKGSDKS